MIFINNNPKTTWTIPIVESRMVSRFQSSKNLRNALDTARALTEEMRKTQTYVLSYPSAGSNYNPVQRPEMKLNIKVEQVNLYKDARIHFSKYEIKSFPVPSLKKT